MIYLAVCDDDRTDLERNREFLVKWMKLHREPVEIRTYEYSGELLFDIEEGVCFDLILCDIEMPGISGMEIAGAIREKLPYCIMIFITSYLKYAVDAFALNIFRFIPKEELEPRLSDALEDALDLLRIQQEKYYVIRNANYIEKIAYQDIIYIQKEKNYTVFHLKHHGKTRVRKSLRQVLDELAEDDYVLIQRDIAVNLLHVIKLESGRIDLQDQISLPVSSNRQESVKNKIFEFWEDHL